MENASKALMIAAAVLIAIVLIAVGIKILSSTQGVTNEVDKVSEAMGMSVFNSQFTDYDGTQTGNQVRELLNKAVATHRNGSNHIVNVSAGTNTYDTADEIATYRASIVINQTYSVVVTDTDGDGFVDKITIK